MYPGLAAGTDHRGSPPSPLGNSANAGMQRTHGRVHASASSPTDYSQCVSRTWTSQPQNQTCRSMGGQNETWFCLSNKGSSSTANDEGLGSCISHQEDGRQGTCGGVISYSNGATHMAIIHRPRSISKAHTFHQHSVAHVLVYARIYSQRKRIFYSIFKGITERTTNAYQIQTWFITQTLPSLFSSGKRLGVQKCKVIK